MTPDIDLDALTALEQSIPPAPWRVAPTLPAPSVRTDGGTELVYATWFDSGPAVLKFIAAARNNWSALLSALTATRAELDAFMHARIQGDDMAARVTWLSDELVRVEAERDFWKSKRHPDAARQDVEYWKGKYEAGAMDQLAAVAQPDINRKLDVLCECRNDGQCEHNGAAAPQPICGDTTFGEVCAKPAGHVEAGDTWHERADQLAAAPQPDDERWTWAVSCPGCGQAKGHPCIGALGGDGAVHPERRGRAVAFGYGLNAAAGAGDGDWLDPSTPAPEEARVLRVGDGEQDTATTHSTGTTQVWPSFADQCVTTHTGSTWAGAGAPASVQGAADGEAQA